HGFADLLVRGALSLRPTAAMSSIPDPLVRDALEEVLRLGERVPEALRISALSQLACVPPYADDMRQSKELSGRALELARALGEPKPLRSALRAQLYSLSGPDDIEALLAITNEMLELERDGGIALRTEAFSARLGALAYRGETAAAERVLDAVAAAAEERDV